jgi:Ala-tRNA(Pro) deacylase
MPGRELKEYLDSKQVRYEIFDHAPAYTAQEVAHFIHVHGWDFAKPVIVRANGQLMMVVVPAPLHVDLARLRRFCRAEVELVPEWELGERFPGTELGAMPPFGNLFGLPVMIDRRLAERPRIVFNAGSHAEALRVAYVDYERLVQPTVAEIAVEVHSGGGRGLGSAPSAP